MVLAEMTSYCQRTAPFPCAEDRHTQNTCDTSDSSE